VGVWGEGSKKKNMNKGCKIKDCKELDEEDSQFVK